MENKRISVLVLLMLIFYINNAKAQYKNCQHVVCMGGGVKSAGQYKNYSVVGEPAVDSYLNTGAFVTTIGFLTREESPLTTNISESNSSSQNSLMQIYPNPSSGNFTLKFLSDKNFLKGTVSVFNSVGQNVYLEAISDLSFASTFEVKIAVAPGIYFVNLSNSEKEYRQKVLIE